MIAGLATVWLIWVWVIRFVLKHEVPVRFHVVTAAACAGIAITSNGALLTIVWWILTGAAVITAFIEKGRQ